ncbi:hypothetical protein [Spirosoma telluris]
MCAHQLAGTLQFTMAQTPETHLLSPDGKLEVVFTQQEIGPVVNR